MNQEADGDISDPGQGPVGNQQVVHCTNTGPTLCVRPLGEHQAGQQV